jgi:protein SCO1/2
VESAQQFSHPAALFLCTPDGRLSRYLYGVKFEPKTLRLSLVEASDGKVGSAMDQLFLTCFQYDGHQGKYAFAAMGLMRAGGLMTVIVIAVGIFRMLRREQRERALTEKS